ncbi:MAG: uncharacterized protein KVP18_002860 [Porospora cf. gigantea A]|uniref:uncharacterized protein n=1 Tax=Porospora cf. gigantea A TaxID=2853593 RepID=UPI003559EF95|nr:MAG: hypothetical protein KVP18_002860 [Porospora cf. gigantea A]
MGALLTIAIAASGRRSSERLLVSHVHPHVEVLCVGRTVYLGLPVLVLVTKRSVEFILEATSVLLKLREIPEEILTAKLTEDRLLLLCSPRKLRLLCLHDLSDLVELNLQPPPPLESDILPTATSADVVLNNTVVVGFSNGQSIAVFVQTGKKAADMQQEPGQYPEAAVRGEHVLLPPVTCAAASSELGLVAVGHDMAQLSRVPFRPSISVFKLAGRLVRRLHYDHDMATAVVGFAGRRVLALATCAGPARLVMWDAGSGAMVFSANVDSWVRDWLFAPLPEEVRALQPQLVFRNEEAVLLFGQHLLTVDLTHNDLKVTEASKVVQGMDVLHNPTYSIVESHPSLLVVKNDYQQCVIISPEEEDSYLKENESARNVRRHIPLTQILAILKVTSPTPVLPLLSTDARDFFAAELLARSDIDLGPLPVLHTDPVRVLRAAQTRKALQHQLQQKQLVYQRQLEQGKRDQALFQS